MSKEEQHYTAILSDLYQGTFDDAAWDRGLMGLADLVGGEGPVLLSVDPRTQALKRFCCYRYDASLFADYANNWLMHDLRVPACADKSEGTLLTETTLLGREWERSLIFNEFMRPNDCPHTLMYFVRKQPENFTSFSIPGTRSRGKFEAEDVQRITPLLPHIKRALEIKDRLEQHGLRAGALRNVVQGLSFGVVILDDQHKLLEASPFASIALQSVCKYPLTTGCTFQLPEPAQRILSALLASALTRGHLADGLIHVPRGPGKLPISLLVAPAPTAMEPWILTTPRWLLFVFDPEQRLLPKTAVLERELNLSPREAQVAALLASGMPPTHIASRLGISLNTLRTHIKSCLTKTGGHTQGELARQIVSRTGWGQAALHPSALQ